MSWCAFAILQEICSVHPFNVCFLRGLSEIYYQNPWGSVCAEKIRCFHGSGRGCTGEPSPCCSCPCRTDGITGGRPESCFSMALPAHRPEKREGACVRCGSAQSGMKGEAAWDERRNAVLPASASRVATWPFFGQMSYGSFHFRGKQKWQWRAVRSCRKVKFFPFSLQVGLRPTRRARRKSCMAPGRSIPFCFLSSVTVSLLPTLTLRMPSEETGETTFIETLHSKRRWWRCLTGQGRCGAERQCLHIQRNYQSIEWGQADLLFGGQMSCIEPGCRGRSLCR